MNREVKPDDEKWLAVWGADWVLEGCAICNGVFVLPPKKVSQRCPICGQTALAQMSPADDRPIYTQPPELLLPFRAAREQIQQNVAQFAKSVWLAPADLQSATLLGRLQPVYLPMWLVDVQVQGEWQAEMGFDYEIVSHREQYKNSDWRTERVKERRVRWEPRVGRLNRTYHNQIAPALEQQAEVEGKIGRFQTQDSQPFQPAHLADAIVHLPNRPPEDAWNEAVVGLQTAVAQECRQASEANHTRGFKWSPRFANQNWTQLLLPLYTSYYLDDDNQAQLVLLHGQTGQLHAPKRASMKRAQRMASIVAAVAAVFLLLTLVLLGLGVTVAEEAFAWAGVAGVLAIGVGGTAVLPLLYAWYINTTAKQ
ncbi:MAG: hypothetical protein R3D55_10680 [Chloroflexota bacterium]